MAWWYFATTRSTFSNDDMWTENDWDKHKFTQDDICRVFGPDNAASIYTGEIIRVSGDGRVIEHDINTYKGCSGAIIFLLDKRQPTGLVNSQDYGKAIAIHAGCAVSEKKFLTQLENKWDQWLPKNTTLASPYALF